MSEEPTDLDKLIKWCTHVHRSTPPCGLDCISMDTGIPKKDIVEYNTKDYYNWNVGYQSDYVEVERALDEPTTMTLNQADKRGYQWKAESSLDVDRPLFDLFGIDFDNDTSTKCPICHKLVGYDMFTFSNKEFYHVTCYYNTKVRKK